MCGIGMLLSISGQDNPRHDESEWNNLLSKTLSRRGPDVPRRVCHYEFSDKKCASLTLHGSVLHMRGARPQAQPLLFSLQPSTGVCDRCQSCDVEKHSDDSMTEIPVSPDDCALCWNGECYTYCTTEYDKEPHQNSCRKYGTMVELVRGESTRLDNSYHPQSADQLSSPTYEHSDTTLVKELLLESIAKTRQYTDSNVYYQDVLASEHEAITRTMARIHGEYSFLLYVPPTQAVCGSSQGYVYYGRDVLGRRSLLINKSVEGVVVLSSVATSFKSQKRQVDGPNVLVNQGRGDSLNSSIGDGWEELPPGIVYRIDVSTGEVTSMAIQKIRNKEVALLVSSVTSAIINDDTGYKATLGSDSIITGKPIDHAAKCLLHLLDNSIQRRVLHAPMPNSQSQSEPSVAVLFSGGIDSVILAALSHRHIPFEKPIDLINVSFYEDSDSFFSALSPDRLAALHSYCEMATKWPERNWRFIAVDVSYREVLDMESNVLQLLNPLDSTMDFNIAVAFWFAGRGRGRIVNQENAIELVRGVRNHTVTQRKSSSSQEPLLRFAKANTSMANSESRNGAIIYKRPSTNTSKQRMVCARDGCTRPAPLSGCIFSTCKFCCGKLQSPISKFLGRNAQLCPVHNHGAVVLQTSAARMLSCEDDPLSCRSTKNDNSILTSTAKILLSGVGADEQMAGYGRHRSTFQRGGLAELEDELKMEVERLWTRNLGRDDRCLSDCGKEARFPYLDEDVVLFLEEVPVQMKCNLDLPQGEGDKLILRRVARIIGVDGCSTLVKRAIQFGSRIAKVSDKNRFGSQRRATGAAKHVFK